MSKFDRDDYSAIVNGAEFPAKLDQCCGKPFAQTRSDRVRIAQEHRPPLAHCRFEELTQIREFHPEQRFDELCRSEGGYGALGERVASKLSPIVPEQRGGAENLTRRDQTDEHGLAAIQDAKLGNAGVEDINAIRFVAELENRAPARNAMRTAERHQSLEVFL